MQDWQAGTRAAAIPAQADYADLRFAGPSFPLQPDSRPPPCNPPEFLMGIIARITVPGLQYSANGDSPFFRLKSIDRRKKAMRKKGLSPFGDQQEPRAKRIA
jgi:hypothetical protein